MANSSSSSSAPVTAPTTKRIYDLETIIDKYKTPDGLSYNFTHDMTIVSAPDDDSEMLWH